MRKLRTMAVAVLGLLAFATVAFAIQENDYTVDGAVTPIDSGTKKKPKPVALKFGYTVSEENNKRPALIKKYTITFAGLQVNTNFFKGCSAEKIDAAQSDSVCPKGSLIGTGSVQNATGSSSNENDKSLACFLELRVHNSRNNKAALYLHGEPSPQGAADPKNCPLTVDKAIDARFVRSPIGTSLEFVVDEFLLHPAPGFDNAVTNVNSSIPKKTRKVKGKTRGYFESIGQCRNKTRAITVTFTPENGTPAETAQKLVPCTK